jgi:hypothetical protein
MNRCCICERNHHPRFKTCNKCRGVKSKAEQAESRLWREASKAAGEFVLMSHRAGSNR